MMYKLKEIVARIKAGHSDDDIAAALQCPLEEVEVYRDVVEHPEIFTLDFETGLIDLRDPREN